MFSVWAVGYGYDANGHLDVRFTPSGQYYIYQPDALGQPTELGIQNVNVYVYSVSHYPDGHIAAFTWTNGLTHQVTENVRGLPSEIHDSMQGVDAEDLAYTYDADGNTKTILDYADGARSASMSYDGLDRLSSASITGIAGNVPTQYSYNALDQITGVTQGTHVLTYTYGSYYNDELAQVVDNQNGTTSFGYDTQGNLSSRNGVAYTFDVGNRLRNVAGEEGGYAYDGWGRRVAQTDASGTIYSFYDDGGQLIYQRDRAGGTHDYLYLGGKLVGVRNYDTGGIARGWHFQDTDALGSVIRQTDNSGQEVANTGVVYDAWGGQHGVIPQDGPGYTGHVEDADTNLVYMQQRYYDPSVGRFLSMDPVDASGTDGSNLDRYWYAQDNPYRYTDPDGRQPGDDGNPDNSAKTKQEHIQEDACTGSNIVGVGCAAPTLSIVGTPSAAELKAVPSMQNAATGVSPHPAMFASNSDAQVKKQEKILYYKTLAQEIQVAALHGKIPTDWVDTGVNIGKLSGGLLLDNMEAGRSSFNMYVTLDYSPNPVFAEVRWPINWSNVDWAKFARTDESYEDALKDFGRYANSQSGN